MSDERRDEKRDERLEGLLVQLIDAAESGDRELIEEIFRRHPDDEDELRSHLSALSALSLLEDGTAGPTPPLPAVGDYRLLRPLGRGGMGQVWLAEQASLRRVVAVKMIRAGAGAAERARERFRREARAMAMLDHPHVARVFDSGTHESGVDWIAMEYIPGRGLDEVFAAAGRDPESLGTRRLVGWCTQIAGALAGVHEAGVIHRDIKPSNIRIRPDGTAVLIDFGLARHLHEGSLSRTGDFVGSPHYASPEQLSSDLGPVGPATDVYALGLTLYEGLTGLRPFEGDSTEEVFHRILRTDPPRPRRLSSRVSRDLEVVLLTALRKHPARRYASARALRDDLSAWMDDRAIRARREPPHRRAARLARRHPARAAGLAFVLLSVLAGSWLLWKVPEIRRLRAEERRWAVEEALDEGFTLQAAGLLEEARERFGRALDLDPAHGDALAGYALTLLEDRRDDELYAWLDGRDRERPDDRLLALIRRMAMNVHGREGELPKVAPPFTAIESFFRGHIALAAGDAEHAHEFLQDAILIAAPTRPPYVFDLIQAAVQLGRSDEARRYLELARTRWPDHPVADFIEASLVSKQDPGRAASLLETFLHRLPQSPSAWMNLGLARFRAGDVDAAVEALRRGLEIAPHHDPMRYSLGEILYRSGRVDEAIFELETVVRSDDGYQDAWYALAHCHLVLRNDPVAALEPIRRAIELDPEDEAARQHERLIARWTGSFEMLVRSARDALRRDPCNAGAASDLLRGLVELGRPADAVPVLAERHGSLAADAVRWDRLAGQDAWKTADDPGAGDLISLIRVLRARDEHQAERVLADRLRRLDPEERELECWTELARTSAAAARWRRALDDLEVVEELSAGPLLLRQPRVSLLPELAPVFDASRRHEGLPADLREAAADLGERFSRLYAETLPF